MHKKIIFLVIAVLSIFLFAVAQAEEKSEMAELLFVQNSHDVSLGKGKLTLKKVGPTTIFFTDRPKRTAGHMTTKDFVDEWSEGGNSFAADPPNAALSIFGQDEIVDIVVTLKNPRLEGEDLVYDITVLEEDIGPISGQSSLFIDPVGRPMSPTSVAGVHRREVRRHVVR
ncbi:hypothetical protein N9934_04385 [Desulfosarcina sp.]|nr:hypothetical protein [Desulfosarcina sp.]